MSAVPSPPAAGPATALHLVVDLSGSSFGGHMACRGKRPSGGDQSLRPGRLGVRATTRWVSRLEGLRQLVRHLCPTGCRGVDTDVRATGFRFLARALPMHEATCREALDEAATHRRRWLRWSERSGPRRPHEHGLFPLAPGEARPVSDLATALRRTRSPSWSSPSSTTLPRHDPAWLPTARPRGVDPESARRAGGPDRENHAEPPRAP